MLVALHDIEKSFGSKQLFSGLHLSIESGDKVGLIGPNGAGKSTLLKIMSELESADGGEVARQKGAKIVFVHQVPVFAEEKTVSEVLTSVFSKSQQEEIEVVTQVATVVSLLGFEDPDQLVSQLSGGWKKRVSIGQALVQSPDLILLDEPTNHMDWEGIYWLEDLLKNTVTTFVLISHDRTFLEHVANRMVEVNRVFKGGTLSFKGNYSQFLEKKAEYIEGQKSMEASLSNKLRREDEWLRRSPQARTTKSRSRIQAAHSLSDEVDAVRLRNIAGKQSSQIEFSAGEVKSKKLIEVKEAALAFSDKVLFQKLSVTIGPGQCWGVLGLNGSGKTSFLKSLMKEIPLNQGEIVYADGVKVTYFDQSRDQLDPEETLMNSITGGDSDYVVFRDKSMHGAAYARKFLFHPDQFNVRVKYLSGGEQARLLIARLMLQDADILLLDEPTNDLDIETLDVLETSLIDFPGAIVLVSHDRSFLEKVKTHLLALEGDGQWSEYPDFYQWEAKALKRPKKVEKEVKEPREERRPKKKKLSYMEQREWDSIEEEIATAEEELSEAQAMLQNPAIMSNSQALSEQIQQVTEKEGRVERLYERWEYLEKKRSGDLHE